MKTHPLAMVIEYFHPGFETLENKPDKHRKNIRLKDFDYSSAGHYFVTIVSHKRKNIFGKISNGIMELNNIGMIVEKKWQEIPIHFPYIEVDSYVVMPNHVHGIIINIGIGARHASPLQTEIQPLGVVVGSFKSAVTKYVHDLGWFINRRIWQRNYYEHIIRDEDDYQHITEYINNNPFNWENDNENPKN